MRLYEERYFYDDSDTPVWLSCGHCNGRVLKNLGIHAVDAWLENDRLEKRFLK